MLLKKRILSMDISYGSYDEFVNAIINLARSKVSSYVCVANVHMLVEAHQSKSFQEIVNNADIATPDGMPLAKSFELLHNKKQERVDGMSLLPNLLSECEKKNLSVYFFGGAQSTLDATSTFIRTKFPKLEVAGLFSPPFRPMTEEEDLQIASNISNSGANLVFVVLGCPKQEVWMSKMKGKIPAAMIGIGGALPVLVGQQKRAPMWMQKNSLEWLFRLGQEPKRLFKRYLITNSKFIYLITKEKLSKK